MLEKFNAMQKKLFQMQGQKELLIKQKKEAETEKSHLQKELDKLLKARAVAQIVAEATQKKLEYHFSNLVTLALAIFPDPYTFELRFVPRRNKIEADLVFSKNGHETDDIMNAAGGGVVDIVSLALLFACQGLSKSEPVILLDEPAKFLSEDLQEKASEMIKLLSEELSIQIIMVTHLINMINAADNVIKLKNINGEAILEGGSE